jgi:transportin-3
MWSDFEQLPADSHASLRDSLLSHLTQHADGAGNVLTQLCLALACLAVRMPAWDNPIADVHARLGTQQNTTRALVEFLTVLPECATDSKLPVEQARRRAVSVQLAGSAPQVYELLSHLSRSDASVPSERVLRGFLSWFRLSSYELAPAAGDAAGSAARDAAVAEVMRSSNPLVQLAMDELFKPDDDCFEVAVDVSIELVRLLTGESGCDGDDGGSRGGSGESALVRQASSLSMLGPLLERLVAQLQAHVRAQDEDAARGLCRLLTETGEACSPLITSVLAGTLPAAVSAAIDPATAQRAAQLTEALLLCTAHPTPEVAEIAFNFWYVTMLEIASRLEGEQRAAAQRAWTPAYLQLTAALERAMVLPAESESWSADGFDDFRRFRFACSDGLSDAAKVAGGDVVLGTVVEAIQAGLATLSTTGEWRPLDGALHAAKALSSYVSASRDEPVASMLGAICALPLSSAHQLVHSAVMCASGFASWLHSHPDRLGAVLSFVSASLATGDAQVAPAACVAVKNICDACSEQLAAEPWASQLLTLVVGSRELPLASADRAELLAGAGYVYSLLEVERVVRFLEALATPILHRLSQLCPEGSAQPPSSEVCSLLDQLVALVRYCQPSVPEFAEFHPITNMLKASWPVLTSVQRHLHRDCRYARAPTSARASSARPPRTRAGLPSARSHRARPPLSRASPAPSARWRSCVASSSLPCAPRART